MTAPPAPSDPVVAGRDGRTASTLAFMLSLAVGDEGQARRIRTLVDELDDISIDRCFAVRFEPQHETRRWLRQLADEERATWRALREAAGIQKE